MFNMKRLRSARLKQIMNKATNYRPVEELPSDEDIQDFTDTDSNYTPPQNNTSSDETSTEENENNPPPVNFVREVNKTYAVPRTPLNEINDFSHISNSPDIDVINVEKKYFKRASLPFYDNETNSEIVQKLNETFDGKDQIPNPSNYSDINRYETPTIDSNFLTIKTNESVPLFINCNNTNTIHINDVHGQVSQTFDDFSIQNEHENTENSMVPYTVNDSHASKNEVNQIDENTISAQKSKIVNVNRTKDFCFYCESSVLNFARHIFRHHENETEVQQILSKPKNSQGRKVLLTKLRKKGNYIQNSVELTKPMRKHKLAEYLPCNNCLGFYSRKLLWKHKKKCTGVNNKNVQTEAQNLLVKHLKVDNDLKEHVFPRMRADKISLIAKSDPLICAFGSQYMKIHREKHFINVTSRKMRELSRLLQEIKRINKTVSDLFHALRPENYDLIVEAAKILGKYDPVKEKYESPTFSMNISTSLKQCCNIAIMLALKKQGPYIEVDTAKVESDLKTMIQLIDANWKYDISSQAAADLNQQKWNKITIVPLANDLKMLKEHLCKKAEEAASKIKNGEHNIATYIQLLETVYCRQLLLNRRRPGELQRIKTHDYQTCDVEKSQDKYEEFDRALSATERILLKRFKRVVIRGKRGRGVPVLFNLEIQEDINLLLSVRQKYLLKTNNFLFGNPGYETPIYGYKALEKWAKSSGAKNPKSISSTRLRKHLATLTQIFSMTENDLEQLATFMGHTSAVHKKSYRLPDDVYQTAKISKLLLLMEDGKADTYKGKTLDEIDLDLNEDLIEDQITNEDIIDYDFEPSTSKIPAKNQANPVDEGINETPQAGPSRINSGPSQSVTLDTSNKKAKKRCLVPWTIEQKKVVTAYFKQHITKRKPPKRHECELLKEKTGDILKNKEWLKIKVFVQNIYAKK